MKILTGVATCQVVPVVVAAADGGGSKAVEDSEMVSVVVKFVPAEEGDVGRRESVVPGMSDHSTIEGEDADA
jgi:hypothetical protein